MITHNCNNVEINDGRTYSDLNNQKNRSLGKEIVRINSNIC